MRIGILKIAYVLLGVTSVGASSKSNRGTSTTLRRIKKEYKDAVDMGIAYDWVNQKHIRRKSKSKPKCKKNNHIICLGPITTNLRQWHFSFKGAGDGSYSQGVYHGQILLPKDYPLSPPSIQLWTPSGRFLPFTDICLSASNYHPESWTPRWSIHGIVNALRLHMLNAPNEIGGMHSDHEETLEHARLSQTWKKTFVSGKTSTRITVDHELLIETGVIRLNQNEEEDEIEEYKTEQEETFDNSLLQENPLYEEEPISDSELEEALEIPQKAAASKKVSKSKTKKRINDKIRRSYVPSFKAEAVTSILQMAILYMVVLLFLNK